MDSLLVSNFAFPCGLCGFNVYKELWNPKLNEKLEIIHEQEELETVSWVTSVVAGHPPRKISRFYMVLL